MSRLETVFVFADWKDLNGPTLMGLLHRSTVRAEEVLSFEYDAEWLSQAQPFHLDPRLQFVRGRQYADEANPFGLFLDSAPDRWGRLLIRRRFAFQGWKLSPAYDLNAQPWGGGLALNIDENSNACKLDLARSVGQYFRLSSTRQQSIISEVSDAVKVWKSLAQSMGLKRSEVERMRTAFEEF